MQSEMSQGRIVALLVSAFLFLFLVGGIAPPTSFPEGTIVEVPQGQSLSEVARLLEGKNIIRSAFWFRGIAIITGGARRMQAGPYYFEYPQSAVSIVWRMARGIQDVKSVKVTVPEGFTVKQISALFDERFVSFDNRVFELTAPEGYLFPDTYFLPVTATATSTIKLMRDNFLRRIFPVMPEIEDSGRSLEDIITLASLIEGEANNQKDREMVSDILWKRLKIGMPLQVDVEMKTYEFQGLPEKPINNPGLLSIKAAIHPTSTPYIYYLTGHDGKMYYAKTFDEHKANIVKYLPN